MAEANFAAASKMAVGRPRSSGGNQSPIALAFAGKIGAAQRVSGVAFFNYLRGTREQIAKGDCFAGRGEDDRCALSGAWSDARARMLGRRHQGRQANRFSSRSTPPHRPKPSWKAHWRPAGPARSVLLPLVRRRCPIRPLNNRADLTAHQKNSTIQKRPCSLMDRTADF